MAENKESVRNAYREKRDAMDRGQVETLSSKICAHLTASDLFAQAEYLYAYAPLGNEADIRPAVEAAWQQGKRIAFPKVFGEEMRFFEVTDFAQLEEGAFGIMEPSETAGAVPVDWRVSENRCGGEGSDAPAEPLLVLVPGVAFDHSGHRLGFGKGYYDRHFAACGKETMLLGVAYAFQIAEALPVELHDLRVSHLLTEDGIE
ncbi:MAG: 5-formyltetrahydrofolate cyclo-ligase [Bacteroidales bacterium]|nr:5-formyltetrahydrofolate cyclo-ligase [Bacteroidales bacterium]